MFFSKHADKHAPTHSGDKHDHATGLTQADVDRAYERGRKEERARHRSHPVLALLVFAVAVAGAGMVFLAAKEGSFTRGGQVLDHKLAGVAEHAQAGSVHAAILVADAGRQVAIAGKSLKQNSSQN